MGLPSPGHNSPFTVLNVLGSSLQTGRYISDPLNCGKSNTEYYNPKDLAIGASLDVYGRKVVLTDCDPFTKEFYRAKYGMGKLSIAIVFIYILLIFFILLILRKIPISFVYYAFIIIRD